jgi:hypothetical protein
MAEGKWRTMKNVRKILAAAVFSAAAITGLARPAQAQVFYKMPDYRGGPITGSEPGVLSPMPGATPEELRAGMVWSLRAALNVAALQCQFEPTLLTLNQYNHLIGNRSAEFTRAYKTLESYFKRTNKTPKAAQTAIDQYGTRVYISFSAVQAQRGFCQNASIVGREALFAPKDSMADFAALRLRQIRNSLIPMGDMQFPRFLIPYQTFQPITLDSRCWDKKDELKKNCRARG